MAETKVPAHIIVIGNEKGGTGKSTIAMHLAIKLLNEGFSVATMDFDGRQGSLSKYIQNRKNFCANNNLHLGIPEHYVVKPTNDYNRIPEDLNRIHDLILDIKSRYDAIIIDTKKFLAAHGKNYLNWIVCGNKISATRSRNKEFIFEQLEKIGKTYGFRFCSGLKDRVIYRELFLEGLTVLDMNLSGLNRRMTTSHLAAKIEIKNLAEFICP